MDRARYLRIYDLHSWVGILFSFSLYVICFSGTTAVFVEELKSWEDPTLRASLPDEPAPVHDTVVAWIEENAGSSEVEGIFVRFPAYDHPMWEVTLETHDANDTHIEHRLRLDARTGGSVPIVERGNGLSYWLRYFHHHLMWPTSLGGSLVGGLLTGIVGVALGLAILSGMVTHRKFLVQIFTLRLARSVRLKWQDSHNIIGVWGMPFFAMIAVTGAFMGFTPNVFPLMVASLQPSANELAPTEHGETHGSPASERARSRGLYSMDRVLRRSHSEGAPRPTAMSLRGWGGSEPTYHLEYGDVRRELNYFALLTIDGHTGKQVEPESSAASSAERLVDTSKALHFGTFGGVLMKLVYTALGLLLSIVVALGNMMWLERRRYGNAGNRSKAFYQVFSRVNVGVCLGLPLGTALIFHADKLIPVDPESRLGVTGGVYLAGLFLALSYAFVRTNGYRATRELMFATGALFALLPLVNWTVTGDLFLEDLLGRSQMYAWVDASLLIIGVVTFGVGLMVPRVRPERVN